MDDECIVCGCGPTVNSHILPRALLHDIRKEAKHLVSGSIDKDGVGFHQSGFADRFLCRTHEDLFHQADDYAIDLCRAFAAGKYDVQSEYLLIANPVPQLLTRFAIGVVWRWVWSSYGRRLGLKLGSHEPKVRKVIFEHQVALYQLIVTRSRASIKDRRVDLATYPSYGKMSGLNGWQFQVLGLMFNVFISNERLEQNFNLLDATQKEALPVLELPLEDVRRTHSALTQRMKRRQVYKRG
ncbi:hypothetical protein [Rhizobium sp. SRDI969]|uniref:hypothetical protein n=1 Tax=Rhizobium sp. SRDI969 TaxID=3138252 RepID=UPI0021A67F33|nr:hypothetical protein [Rhizobium leguminosarum]UWM84945.1 hypothetical protein N2A41_29595 [Rhizobium leguminosarum bv. viciae]